jgi:UDP-glucose 4-epimerase
MMEAHLADYAGKTILITGGAGAIGSNLTQAVAQLNARQVIVLDDLSAAAEWNVPLAPNVTFIRGSVTDDIALRRAFRDRPDLVYHLAAFFANQNSVDHPEADLETNGRGTLLVYQHALACGAKRVVYTSSGCSIYGSTAPLPLTEEFMSMRLTTPYQITKMLGELYANFFHHHYGLPVVKTRLFNSYGPGDMPGQYRNVIPNFIFRALRGLPLPLTGSGEETRDFTYVGDIVDALLRAGTVEAAVGEEMNIASGREVNILSLAEQINALTGNQAGIVTMPPRVWDNKKRLLASIEKARRVLGYAPQMPFDQGLNETIAWFRANWDRIVATASVPRAAALVPRVVMAEDGVAH